MDLTAKIEQGMKDLPTLPTVYSALCDVMARPQSTAEAVAQIVANDQASAFRVLKVVNSAFYGFPGRIDTISRAVVILGFDEIRNLILATSVMNMFSKRDSALDFRPSDFWAHSIAVGMIARALGRSADKAAQENLFLAGILHDVGKLLFFEFAGDDFARAVNLAAEREWLLRDAEKEVLGMDHSVAGSLLAGRWRLPEPIQAVIRYHHGGTVAGAPDMLVATVHIADFLARILELGHPGDNLVPEPDLRAWETLKLPPGRLEEEAPAILRNYEEAVSVLLHK